MEAQAKEMARYLLSEENMLAHHDRAIEPLQLQRQSKTNHPERAVTIPKPPATLSNISTCAPSAAVVAYGVAKSAAAMKEKRKMRQNMARAKGTFVRTAPRNNTKLTNALRSKD